MLFASNFSPADIRRTSLNAITPSPPFLVCHFLAIHNLKNFATKALSISRTVPARDRPTCQSSWAMATRVSERFYSWRSL